MRKIFTSLLMVLALCTAIIAAVRTEMRMHVFSNGDNGMNMVKALAEVDSVKFTNDTLESEKLYTSEFYNDGKLFDTFTDCSYDSVPVLKPNRDTTAAYTYTFKGWKRDESEIAKNKLTYTATYDSIIRKYAVVFFGENSEVYSLASLAYGTMPVNPVDNGINPTKASTKLNDFVFYKWNPDLSEVESDIAYRAEFESRMHPYTCMFYNCDTLFKTVENCAYDYEPAVDTPAFKRSEVYKYDFDSWSLDTGKVSRDTLIYTAVYDSMKILYTRLYYNCDTLYEQIDNCAYDSVVTLADPTRRSTEVYKYDFDGWTLDESKIANDTLIYTAVYNAEKILYTRLYYNCDTLYEQIDNCAYDSVVTVEPTRASIQDYDYEFLEWKRDESKISEKQLVYTAVYSMKYTGEKSGAIQVAYKVSDNDSVYFSRGNLQYCAGNGTVHKTADGTIAQGTWRFAENQYDMIGEGNSNIDSTYTGWIDLFGMGTSGWNSKATCYQPWSKSETYSDYYPGGSFSVDLTGTYANADWGVFNAISNGGNEPNKWRTLTTSEWQYLFQNNKWTLGYIKTTDKDSTLCFMLIPEMFNAPEGTSVTVLSTTTSSTYLNGLTVPTNNKYTTEQFASLEQLGVVVLPCGGRRNGTSLRYVGSNGYYWSSSARNVNYACDFRFNSEEVKSSVSSRWNNGFNVRLVQDL